MCACVSVCWTYCECDCTASIDCIGLGACVVYAYVTLRNRSRMF